MEKEKKQKAKTHEMIENLNVGTEHSSLTVRTRKG